MATALELLYSVYGGSPQYLVHISSPSGDDYYICNGKKNIITEYKFTNLINSLKLSDFNKLVNNKKFKKIFIITGENSFYKSKANLLIKFSKNKILKFFFKKSKFPELSELYLILKVILN